MINISGLLSKFTDDELINLKREVDIQLKKRFKDSETRIETLNISPRAYNSLFYNKISTLEELSKMTPRDFLKLSNVGKKTYWEITEVLSQNGLSWSS
jgi:DNA-directed RNA polymerase alpha subunit